MKFHFEKHKYKNYNKNLVKNKWQKSIYFIHWF